MWCNGEAQTSNLNLIDSAQESTSALYIYRRQQVDEENEKDN